MTCKKSDVIICRCEEVYQSEIIDSISQGACTSQEIKMKTRAGMGTCQGRICRSLVESLATEEKALLMSIPSTLTIHNPVRPIHLGQLKREV